MAALNAQDRLHTAIGFMREQAQESFGFTKPQLAAAVAAADDWVEANAVSFNAALPAGFRTTATTSQKIALLGFVLARRTGRLRVTEDS
jgi:hypothetical protein